MKQIIQVLVILFFFSGLLAFVWYQNKSFNEKLAVQTKDNIQNMDSLDTINQTKVYSNPEMPNDSLVNYRILKETSATSSKEFELTNQLIEQYLYDSEKFRKYFMIMSSKTIVMDKPDDKNEYKVNEEMIHNYRKKIKEEAK